MARIPIICLGLAALLAASAANAGDDKRTLVALPPHMQDHMLGNMRDHLVALDEALAALAAGQIKRAGDIVEQRIGMASLVMHDAAHMGKFMPEPMREMGMALHRSASGLAIAAIDAEVENTYAGQRKVFQALRDITQACNTCHTAYRIR